MEISNEELLENMKSMEVRINEKFKQLEMLHLRNIKLSQNEKIKVLEEHLRIVKSLDVQKVQSMLGCSRNWALDRMRKLARLPYFEFRLGDKYTKRPSLIIFQEQKEKGDKLEKIKKLADIKKEVSTGDICVHLGLNPEIYLPFIVSLVNEIVKDSSEYEFVRGINLRKIK
ncbi:MAG: hypothetical protein ACP5NZ_01300 [Nanobdellota archaeon]